MRGNTHLRFGTYTGAVLGLGVYGMNARVIPFVFLSMAGSLFPDVDSKDSLISRAFPFLNKIVNAFTPHRGIFHDAFWNTALVLLTVRLGNNPDTPLQYGSLASVCVNGFLLGTSGHLLLDAFNYPGISFFRPFCKKRIRLGKIKCDSFGERAVTFILATVFTVTAVLFL